MTIRLKPTARTDLTEIRAWSEDNWGRARTRDYLLGLKLVLEKLERNPNLGLPRERFGSGLKSWTYRSHIIFYIARPGGVLSVVRVLHERRNHAALDFSEGFEV